MTPDRTQVARQILQRRTAESGRYPSLDNAVERLAGADRLTLYCGYDPTGASLHIGNTVSLLLLKALARDLDHQVIVLFGDFTARIGDPTGKESTRRVMGEDEIDQNITTWDRQVAKLFGDVPYEIRRNSEWLGGMSFSDVIKLAAKVTVQQMIARDMFQERLKRERPIHLNEFLYPLAQGYDSVAMRVDGEVGGSDQIFNMLVGREFSREMLGKDKLVLATPLLVNPQTGKKMSKSEGELIAGTDSPQEIRRKILDTDDSVTRPMFELCTEVPLERIAELEQRGPREFKEALAAELVRMYHGESSVAEATEAVEIPNEEELLKTLTNVGFSAGELKRLIKEGAVSLNGKRVDRWDAPTGPRDVIQIGKGKTYKVR